MSIHMEVENVKHNVEFELGKEFEEPRLDGKATKVSFIMLGFHQLMISVLVIIESKSISGCSL